MLCSVKFRYLHSSSWQPRIGKKLHLTITLACSWQLLRLKWGLKIRTEKLLGVLTGQDFYVHVWYLQYKTSVTRVNIQNFEHLVITLQSSYTSSEALKLPGWLVQYDLNIYLYPLSFLTEHYIQPLTKWITSEIYYTSMLALSFRR